MAITDIVAGLLIGGALGIINALILRSGVRLALKCGRRAKALLVVIASYALRYTLIAAAIYAILKKGNLAVAVVTLGVLGLLTILFALFQRGRGATEERGS
ncbi:MAG: hypothetical protein WC381_01445 [Kiritimatiellia bacterium]|jgi:VIT1/CCC1 family predicted Fe2+/Mn2+ transporter